MLVSIRRLASAFALCCALVVGTTAYADSRSAPRTPVPSPAESQPHRRGTKTCQDPLCGGRGPRRGATYERMVKPFKAGKFKKGHHGRTRALVKAGLAGAFAYNRLKAAAADAGPALSKALAPLTAGIEGLKNLPHEFHKSDSPDATVNSYSRVPGSK